MNTNLFAFLNAIFYDMSFYGVKSSRDAFMNSLKEDMEHIKALDAQNSIS